MNQNEHFIWPKTIHICEVGPRDGLQNENVRLSVEEKVELIERAVGQGREVSKSVLLCTRKLYRKWRIPMR